MITFDALIGKMEALVQRVHTAHNNYRMGDIPGQDRLPPKAQALMKRLAPL